MSYVPVPKDLTQVKTKVALNLTKRQLIFFSLAGVTGIPLYFLLKKPLTSGVAAIIMVTVMLPFFFMAMYEKDGLPFEKIAFYVLQQKFLLPQTRPYKTENFYRQIDDLVKKEGVPDGKKYKKDKPGNDVKRRKDTSGKGKTKKEKRKKKTG